MNLYEDNFIKKETEYMKKVLFMFILFNILFTSGVFAKYCSNCGVVLDEKAKFCPECGNSQNNSVTKVEIQEKGYTGESALKYLKEQSIYIPSLPLATFATEYAKFKVEADKIIEQSKTENKDELKADFMVPIFIIDLLETAAINVNSILAESDTYTDYNIFTKRLEQYPNDKIGKIRSVWSSYKAGYDKLTSLDDVFKPYSKCVILNNYQKVKEVKEKEKNEKGRMRTKCRHALFTYTTDIKIFDAIFVVIDSHRFLITKDDFRDFSITVKNISDYNIYGCGSSQISIGLIK